MQSHLAGITYIEGVMKSHLQLISSIRCVSSYDVVFLELAGISSSGQVHGISTRYGLQHYTPPLRSLAVQSRQAHHYIQRLDLGEDSSARRAFLGIRTPETMLQEFCLSISCSCSYKRCGRCAHWITRLEGLVRKLLIDFRLGNYEEIWIFGLYIEVKALRYPYIISSLRTGYQRLSSEPSCYTSSFRTLSRH